MAVIQTEIFSRTEWKSTGQTNFGFKLTTDNNLGLENIILVFKWYVFTKRYKGKSKWIFFFKMEKKCVLLKFGDWKVLKSVAGQLLDSPKFFAKQNKKFTGFVRQSCSFREDCINNLTACFVVTWLLLLLFFFFFFFFFFLFVFIYNSIILFFFL